MNVENLRTLADYLLRPKLEASFDMNEYAENGYTPHMTCGSVGCAVGHGPYAGILPLAGELWHQYSDRAFGADTVEWCFSSTWRRYDNTPEGAAHRILYLLKHGKPPKEWDYEQYQEGWWR